MKISKDRKTFFIIVGAVILGIFISISVINMTSLGEYYLSADIIKGLDYSDGKLVVTARSDMVSVCVKETKTDPAIDSLCWTDTIDSKATTTIYEYKTYYIWTKDANGVISYYNEYNTKNDK